WSVVPSPNPGSTGDNLSAVTALSSNDVWAAGSYSGSGPNQSLVMHWNGSQWSVVPSPSPGSSINWLYGIAAQSAGNVWAVGEYNNGTGTPYQTLTMHWNGTQWSVVPSPNVGSQDNHLYGVADIAANDVWAAGYVGNYESPSSPQTLVMHWDGTQWSVVPSQSPGSWRNYLYAAYA